MNAERGRRTTAILLAVRALANVEDDAIGEEGDRTEAGRRSAPRRSGPPDPGASAFRPESFLFVKRRADETIVTDDAFDRAVEAIDLEEDDVWRRGRTACEPSITPPTTASLLFWGRSRRVTLEQCDREEANYQHAQNDARSDLAVHGCIAREGNSWVLHSMP